jgi:Undecaprenyl-phosphate galactose phosphotransferase WbaP
MGASLLTVGQPFEGGLVTLPSGALSRRAACFKRLLDVVLGTLLFMISLPLSALISLLIVLESGWPVFFAHTRIGEGGRPFKLWKFRTMRVDGDEVLQRHLAEDPDVAAEWLRCHKLKQDPRVTRIGRILRKRSLDELPQIWNVLRGDMSLVGPRPIVQEEAAKYGRSFDLYARVRPGLTGLWQVSGRSDTSYRNRIALDSAYIRDWTPFLELRVLLRTVGVVLNGHGAY